jgi:hypothetical protein
MIATYTPISRWSILKVVCHCRRHLFLFCVSQSSPIWWLALRPHLQSLLQCSKPSPTNKFPLKSCGRWSWAICLLGTSLVLKPSISPGIKLGHYIKIPPRVMFEYLLHCLPHLGSCWSSKAFQPWSHLLQPPWFLSDSLLPCFHSLLLPGASLPTFLQLHPLGSEFEYEAQVVFACPRLYLHFNQKSVIS